MEVNIVLPLGIAAVPHHYGMMSLAFWKTDSFVKNREAKVCSMKQEVLVHCNFFTYFFKMQHQKYVTVIQMELNLAPRKMEYVSANLM